MISYCIEQVFPSDDERNNNVISTYDSCKKDELTQKIINYIIEFMYEFCSEDYGHGIKIISYDDFCNKFWEINGFKINGWNQLFRIYYFEKKWKEWKIDEFKEEIYIKYIDKFINLT